MWDPGQTLHCAVSAPLAAMRQVPLLNRGRRGLPTKRPLLSVAGLDSTGKQAWSDPQRERCEERAGRPRAARYPALLPAGLPSGTVRWDLLRCGRLFGPPGPGRASQDGSVVSDACDTRRAAPFEFLRD